MSSQHHTAHQVNEMNLLAASDANDGLLIYKSNFAKFVCVTQVDHFAISDITNSGLFDRLSVEG
jgi:hypothetical protein